MGGRVVRPLAGVRYIFSLVVSLARAVTLCALGNRTCFTAPAREHTELATPWANKTFWLYFVNSLRFKIEIDLTNITTKVVS